MALDLDRLTRAVDIFRDSGPEARVHYVEAMRQVVTQLQGALPALCESDLAAVSYYIAQAFASARHLSLREASDALADTAMGYSMGAAQLLGMIDA